MTNEEVAVRLTDRENEIGSLKHRMSAVEADQEALRDLTGSVRELTVEGWKNLGPVEEVQG